MTTIQRIKGQPGASYEVVFIDQHGHLIVALTEWYRIRSTLGPTSTRDTYLSCLLPFFAFLSEKGCAWNASPEQLRPVLTNFYRERFAAWFARRAGESVLLFSPHVIRLSRKVRFRSFGRHCAIFTSS